MKGLEARPHGGAAAALAAALLLAGSGAALAVGKVSGKYLGNGKPAALVHARVVPHEPWDGEPAYTIVLSEKDPAGVEKPDFDALFGKLGHALVVNVTRSGQLIGTQVCHQALEKSGFSSSGTLQVEGFEIEAGKLSARFFTAGENEFFGDRWEVDLKVEAALPAGK
jgi:hypothetical protein